MKAVGGRTKLRTRLSAISEGEDSPGGCFLSWGGVWQDAGDRGRGLKSPVPGEAVAPKGQAGASGSRPAPRLGLRLGSVQEPHGDMQQPGCQGGNFLLSINRNSGLWGPLMPAVWL